MLETLVFSQSNSISQYVRQLGFANFCKQVEAQGGGLLITGGKGYFAVTVSSKNKKLLNKKL